MRRIGPVASAAAFLLALCPGSALAARAWTTSAVSQPTESSMLATLATTQSGDRIVAYQAGRDPGTVAIVGVVYPASGGAASRTDLQVGGGFAPKVAAGGGHALVAWTSGGSLQIADRPD